MDERLRFVARLLDGGTMTEACQEFGISRKTGYKIYDQPQEAWVAPGILRFSRVTAPDREELGHLVQRIAERVGGARAHGVAAARCR